MDRGNLFACTKVILLLQVLSLTCSSSVLAKSSLKVKFVTLKKDSTNCYSVRVTYPHFEGSSAVARSANSYYKKYTKDQIEEFLANHEYFMREDVPHEPPSDLYFKPLVALARSDLISVYFEGDAYITGGAHGNHIYSCASFGIVNGKPKLLEFSDIFKPGSKRAVSKQVYDKLCRIQGFDEMTGGKLAIDSPKITRMFLITPSAIVFMARVGCCYACDQVLEAKFPFDELEEYIRTDGPLKPLL